MLSPEPANAERSHGKESARGTLNTPVIVIPVKAGLTI
jgi:hypothetical protein